MASSADLARLMSGTSSPVKSIMESANPVLGKYADNQWLNQRAQFVANQLTGASNSATSLTTNSSGVSGTGGFSDVNVDALGDLATSLDSAVQGEMVSSAAQLEAQKSLIDHANDFTASQNELNRLFQQSSAQTAMEWSSEEAQKTRDWQEKMSNTAYTRAVADLQAAGLNPILAYTNGSASTPAGATGSAYQASGSAGSSASGTASKANIAGGWSADQELAKLTINSAVGLMETLIKAFV